MSSANRDPAHTDLVGRAGAPRRGAGTPTAALRLVAHELRAHVAVLNGYTDLLRDTAVRDDPGRLEQALSSIEQHLTALRAMSDHLSSAVRNGGEVSFGTVDLSELGREAAASVAELARSRDCSVSVEDATARGCPVEGDRFHLLTAMRNLLENACRHGPRGGRVLLRVLATRTRVRIWVRDQGEGLGPLGRAAFEPLTQGDESTAEGMGLGLSLVQETARRHHGRAFWGRDDDGAWVGLEFPCSLGGTAGG